MSDVSTKDGNAQLGQYGFAYILKAQNVTGFSRNLTCEKSEDGCWNVGRRGVGCEGGKTPQKNGSLHRPQDIWQQREVTQGI